MSVWKEVKYALNSSLGKKSFVPLDKLIKTNRHLIVSEQTLFAPKLKKNEINRNETGTRFNVCNFKSFLSGEIDFSIGGSVGVYATGQDYGVIVEIEKNSEALYYKEYSVEDVTDGIDYWQSLNVDVNDEFSVYLTITGSLVSGYPFKIKSPRICAQISDNPITDI